MDMVNMKRTGPIEAGIATVAPDTQMYPYGLVICVDEESISKLGLIAMPMVGEKMSMTATVEVKSVSINESTTHGKDRRIELQITDMALGAMEKEEPEENHAKVLYEMEDM